MNTNTTENSTGTQTASVVVVKSDTAVVKAIASFLSAQAKVESAIASAESGYIGIARAALPVVDRQGYTEKKHVQELLALSFLQQAGKAEGTPEEKQAVLDKSKSDRSNLVAIIMPETKEAVDGRNRVFEYNDKLPAGSRPNLRIGQKLLLEVVRGKATADDIIAIKEGREPAQPTKTSGSQSNATVAVTGATGTSPSTPELPGGQDATVPAAAATPIVIGAAGTITNARDAFKSVLGQMLINYRNNMSVSTQDLIATVDEVVKRFASENP